MISKSVASDRRYLLFLLFVPLLVDTGNPLANEFLRIIPFVGFLGIFLTPNFAPSDLTRVFLQLLPIPILLASILAARWTQGGWAGVFNEFLWVGVLWGYFQIFGRFGNLQESRPRKKKDSAIIPVCFLFSLNLLFLILYIRESGHFFYSGVLIQDSWIPLSPEKLAAFCVLFLPFCLYRFQQEFRKRDDPFKFLVGAGTLVLFLANTVWMLPPVFGFLVLLFSLKSIVQAPGKLEEKQSNKGIALLFAATYFFVIATGLIVDREIRWSWMGLEPEKWNRLSLKIIEGENPERGTSTDLTVQVTNAGDAAWEDDYRLVFQLADSSVGYLQSKSRYGRYGIPVIVNPKSDFQPGTSKIVNLKLDIPFWFERGLLLCKLVRPKIPNFKAELDSAPLSARPMPIAESNFSLQSLTRRDREGYKRMREFYSDRNNPAKRETGKPNEFKTLDIQNNAVRAFGSVFGTPGVIALLFAIIFWSPKILSISIVAGETTEGTYLRMAFTLTIICGIWCALPVTRIGQILLVYFFSRIRPRVEHKDWRRSR